MSPVAKPAWPSDAPTTSSPTEPEDCTPAKVRRIKLVIKIHRSHKPVPGIIEGDSAGIAAFSRADVGTRDERGEVDVAGTRASCHCRNQNRSPQQMFLHFW